VGVVRRLSESSGAEEECFTAGDCKRIKRQDPVRREERRVTFWNNVKK
jgi:hypothetical protein